MRTRNDGEQFLHRYDVRKPARFENGAERKSDAVKPECRELLQSHKKLRFWLFGQFFLVETDAQMLIWLLN